MSSIEPLDRLTGSQEQRLAAVRDKWIAVGFSTARADRPRAEAAARLAYRRAGLSPSVRMVWASSPMGAALTAESLVRRANIPRAAADVVKPVAGLVTRRASERIADSVSARVISDVVHPVSAEVDEQLWGPITQQVALRIRHAIPIPAYGQHDARWLVLYDALGELGLDVSEFGGLMDVAQSCGWWWPFDDVCVLSERHSLVSRDDQGRLHSATGPAVAYPDGWSIWAWHGVVVEPPVILHPELITVAQIQREPDVHTRRVLLERHGFDRYIDESGAIPCHADDTGTLYRCEMAGDEPLVVVSVLNNTLEADGSRRRYVLRVPPEINEAREAIAWTFGLGPEEYRPLRET